MKYGLPLRGALLAAICFGFLVVTSNAQITRQISSAGTTQPAATPAGVAGIQDPEFDQGLEGNDSDDELGIDLNGNISGAATLNRSIAPGAGTGQTVRGNGRAKSNPEIVSSFDGLNFFNQRFANNGNQFSVEPPDQALCAGNGFVLESVNDVLNVYAANGTTLLGVTDLNTFYGYPAAINRAVNPLRFGPSITDPTCHFDSATQRWFHVVLTLDRAAPTTQSLNGKNHLDIAVSNTASPLGSWTIYRLPVQDDGTDGTPDHHCVARVTGGNLVHAQCLGDYPHIGMDANGLFITTNEFDLFSPGRFHGAQIYAISKSQLVAGASTVNVVQFDTTSNAPNQPFGIPGFTVFPALSPGSDFRLDNGGSEFLLSSLAVFSNTGAFDELVLWTLTNTQSLGTTSPAVALATTTVNTQTYAVPPSSFQKAGPFPLGQCLADGTIVTPLGVGCWRLLIVPPPTGPFTNPSTRPPSNDSRMQQVSYANGKLWAALDTAVSVGGRNLAGISYFVLHPQGGGATVVNQGVVAMANNNVTYPAIAVNSSGRGIIAFTLLGDDHYPSAGYTSLDAKVGAGDIHIAAEGAARQDGFSGYFLEVNPIRPRWGDYGAAAVDGTSIWFASEYIANSCDLTTYINTNFTCNNTRGALGNWATRITNVNVQ